MAENSKSADLQQYTKAALKPSVQRHNVRDDKGKLMKAPARDVQSSGSYGKK